MDLFKLVARLTMDSSEYERDIAKARGKFETLGSQISAKTIAIGNLMASGIKKAVDVSVNLGKSAIQNAADVTAEKAQFESTFKTLQGSAKKAFDEISKDTGIFGTRLQAVGTKAFSQFKGAGLEGVEALGMMKDYTTLAADAAAYYDITLEEADERLRSFLRGNTEAGDAIGLFTSESQRNSAAMEKYGAKWQALTEAQKQMLMLDISKDIYKQSGAIGQASRESDAWTNVIGNLKESWKQATGTFGKPIMAVITPILQDVSEFLSDPDVLLKIEQFGLRVGNAIDAVVDFVLNIPSPSEIASRLNAWWRNVLDSLNPFSVTAQIKVQKIEESIQKGGYGAGLQTALDEAWWNPKNWGKTQKKTKSGKVYEVTNGGYGAGFATGLDYVPYNNFMARLHEGEAVLTRSEASTWRSREDSRSTGAQTNALLEELRSLREAILGSRAVMTPDGRVLGDIVTEQVSRNIAAGARRRG